MKPNFIGEKNKRKHSGADHGILRSKQIHYLPYRSKFQARLISSPASEDRQRHTTSTFYQPNDDGNETEKDALAIKWAKERLRTYLLRAARFRINTGHKPLLPLFRKVKARMPPMIDKWVMEMQDVDYELVYKPAKD